MDRAGRALEVPVPHELIDAIAERVAEIVLERLADGARGPTAGRWMRSADAAEYLGWSRTALYRRVSRKEVPHYKVDGILLFRRDELDAWLEQYREEPRAPLPTSPPRAPRRSARKAGAAVPTQTALGRSPEGPSKETSPKKQRPLPPPIGGDDEHKNHWARELEITRAELDEMSPSDFRKAWGARNKRLEEGGVFAHIDELTDAYGWDVIDKMTAGELIKAVADLDLTPVSISDSS